MTYRTVPVYEWDSLPFLTVPDPMSAFIMGAYDGDRLVGFQTCQLQVHLEPIYSTDPHCMSGLVAATEAAVVERYGTCTAWVSAGDRIARLAEHKGYTRLETITLTKRLGCGD